jgi:hypothetical protein
MYRFGTPPEKLGKLLGCRFWNCTGGWLLGENKQVRS